MDGALASKQWRGEVASSSPPLPGVTEGALAPRPGEGTPAPRTGEGTPAPHATRLNGFNAAAGLAICGSLLTLSALGAALKVPGLA